MKRTFPILLLALLLLVGCGSDETAIISEVNTASEFSMAYTDFTGERQTTISLTDSATASVTVALTSKSGSLSISITDEAGNVVFSANDASGASSYTATLSGPADYTVQVEAENHTGSYSVTWEILGAVTQESAGAQDSPPQESDSASQAPEDTQAKDPEQAAASSEDPIPADTEPPASETPAQESQESQAEETAQASAVPDFDPAELNWNGVFTGSDGETTLELWQADSSSYEFSFTRGETLLVGVARIDLDTLVSASYTVSGATIVFTWTDTQTLEVSATGTVAALTLDPTGTYVFSEMN